MKKSVSSVQPVGELNEITANAFNEFRNAGKRVATIFMMLALLNKLTGFSQAVTQTLKGKIIDIETQTPLTGATVVITGTGCIN